MSWEIAAGTNLLTDIGTSNSVFQDAYYIRLKVFNEEQGIPREKELDEFDNTAYHSVIYVDAIPIACGRMNISNDGAKICRIAVIREYRKCGYATLLCNHFISIARISGARYILLHAQIYITDLYRKIGFVSEDEIFLEEGIPHVCMKLKI